MGIKDAVVLEDGPATLIVSVPVAGVVALVSLMLSGEHVTPGSVWQATVTAPVNPVGVIVIVELPDPPAVTVAFEPEIVKLG